MGKLKPGATYVYEKANGVTYAREMGAPASERIAIGWDYEFCKQLRLEEWNRILEAAEQNPALQDALERVKVIYELSRQEQTVDHHPV
mgnify:CR=1 FL=1